MNVVCIQVALISAQNLDGVNKKVGDAYAFREIAEQMTAETQYLLSGPWLFDHITHASMQDEEGNALRPFHTFQIQNGKSLGIFIGEDYIGVPIITLP